MWDTSLLKEMYIKSGKNGKKSGEGVRPPSPDLGSSLPDYFSESLNSGQIFRSARFLSRYYALKKQSGRATWMSPVLGCYGQSPANSVVNPASCNDINVPGNSRVNLMDMNAHSCIEKCATLETLRMLKPFLWNNMNNDGTTNHMQWYHPERNKHKDSGCWNRKNIPMPQKNLDFMRRCHHFRIWFVYCLKKAA